jgi:glycosyltransferase involved in cell wall biosynthesis
MEKPQPLVSVIIPTYNRAHLLSRAIRSILDQTYQNFEIIVVDDRSSDNTEEALRNIRDERIKYIRHEENRGAPAARNTGIKAAQGEFIAFQDSDDEWLPSKLEKQMKEFEIGPSNLGVVFSGYWLNDKNRRSRRPPLYLKKTDGEIHDALLEANFVATPTAVVRRECFRKAGLFESLPRLQEWELWLRISKFYSFKHVNEPLVNVYHQPDSISRNTNAFIIARKFILTKYFEEISKTPELLKQHYFDIGTLLCLNHEVAKGRKYFLWALQINFFDVKIFLSTLASIFGQRTYDRVATIYLRAKGQDKLSC